jgi:predicted ATPase
MKRYVLTGAPGAGKTSVLEVLAAQGFPVVREAATDVIGAGQRRGVAEPWLGDDFIDQVVSLQRRRQRAPAAGAAQLHDRSVLCTQALALFLGRPVTRLLAREVARVTRERVFERAVFFLRPLGFIEATAARRISYPDALAFEKVHEAVYAEHGFEIIDVPPAGVAERAALIAGYVAAPSASPARSASPAGSDSGPASGRASRGSTSSPHSRHVT